MASQRTLNSPCPSQTPIPSTTYPHSKLRRKRDISANRRSGSSLASRQMDNSSVIAGARETCQYFSGNDVISCFPTSGLVVSQHQYAAFVWNSRRPELTQTNLVDIFVVHGDSLQPFIHYRNVNNPTDQAGYITAPVNDTWFGTRGPLWDGQNITMSFYWVVIRSDQTLDGSEIPQSTFTAVQTTYLDSVTSSMASSSSVAAASASSMAAVSLSSVASVHNASPSAGDSVQQANASSSFPHWAIAVIVVLGFLAIVAGCVLAFLIARRLRRRDERSNRSSIGSASPMMANINRSSPIPSGAGLTVASAAGGATSDHHYYRASSVLLPDGTSSISHGGSEGGPFSGADAAIMADAFRKALRKPDFKGSPVEEGDSPDSQQADTGELMSRELAEEGRDIRSVESSRGVQVETLSDTGETAQDH